MGRSNWAQMEALSKDQVQYAAEDAYYTYLLYDKLRNLPDRKADEEEWDGTDRGLLQLKEGWADQGIVRRHDGLYCAMCGNGPMTVPMVVERHMEGKKHRQKLEAKAGITTGPSGEVQELPEKYTEQGIIMGDGVNEVKVGEFKCTICKSGPLPSLTNVDQHIQSKKHQKAMGVKSDPDPKEAEPEGDPFEDCLWNMPDYCEPVQNGTPFPTGMNCTLCTSQATTPKQMYCHLGGAKHQKACRTRNLPELIYIPDKERLDFLESGMAVVRKGFKARRRSSTSAHKASSSTQPAKADSPLAQSTAYLTPADLLLPPLLDGWEEHQDPHSGYSYYYNPETKVSTWERPEAPQPVPQPQPAEPEPAEPEPAQPAQPALVAPALPSSDLPPGWQAVTLEDGTDRVYYADMETQAASWERPPPYEPHEWERLVDPSGDAYWRCDALAVVFYETESRWRRLMDQQQVVYWSNKETGMRFFEPAIPS